MTTFATSQAGGLDDAALARAAAAGDRAAFAAIYDRYADRLHDFCIGMLRDREAAADCVQDVFVTAATKLVQLREPDRLRSWLYAIARSEALARIRARKREMPSEELPDMPTAEADLPTLAARSELADLIAQACGGLTDRDRLVYELAYRKSLDGPELADALGVTHKNANTLVERLRDTIARSLGALLVCRRAKADPDRCPELAEVLAGWDGQFTVLMRKRVARHIEGCAVCEQDRAQMVSPAALLGAAPIVIPAPAWLRARTLQHALAPAPTPGTAPGPASGPTSGQSWWPEADLDVSDLAGPPSGGGAPAGAARPRPKARAGLGVGLVALGIGAALVLSRPAAMRVDPVNAPKPISPTATTPVSTTTIPSAVPRIAPPPPPSEVPSTVPSPVISTPVISTPAIPEPAVTEPPSPAPQLPQTHEPEPSTEVPTTTHSRPKPKPQPPDEPSEPPQGTPPPPEPEPSQPEEPPAKPPPVKPTPPKPGQQVPPKQSPECPVSSPNCNSGPVFS
ncbi:MULTISPECIES: RNA polymerase sigma factor [unclassified Mycobacterium]|uniref:RNA polymerase sigma factor n=1 Tax=unclassified Mycobacterium TaxID=2642494 RepID=UPI0029C73165|nr:MULTISPECIES: sigma-70 family RNA polymerase sigma factor [unclassified Mycobacterium]